MATPTVNVLLQQIRDALGGTFNEYEGDPKTVILLAQIYEAILSGGGGGSGTGEINTGANIGTNGTGVFAGKSGAVLQFYKLLAGSNVTVALTGNNEIQISVPNVGETNTYSSLAGSGREIIGTKSGVDLPFKRIASTPGIDVIENGNDLEITLSLTTLGNLNLSGGTLSYDVARISSLSAITLNKDQIIGTIPLPVSGNIELNYTGKVVGPSATIIHRSATAPTFGFIAPIGGSGSETITFGKSSGSGEYIADNTTINVIDLQLISDEYARYTISQYT